ncbi:MAG: hypothetical protein F4Z04_02805 [Acidobacteria bacterium]|nr:hypothetical protein [Acidobacteriota bacterium]
MQQWFDRSAFSIAFMAVAVCSPMDEALAQGSVQSDRAALVRLYNATDGPNWANSTNWLSDEPLSDWHGVTTDANGRVTMLDLDFNGLDGQIPGAIGDLDRLEVLLLFINDLTGSIPTQIGDLDSLRKLDLGGNDLTGRIPATLGNLTRLTQLGLWSNDLTGHIPDLSNLVLLEHLRLENNRLTGQVPTWIGNLASLTWLALYGNGLTGPLPDDLAVLSRLGRLNLEGNRLSGSIPSGLGESGLYEMNLAFNERLTGPLPPQLHRQAFRALDLAGTKVCIPGSAEFRTWLRAIPDLRSSGLTCGDPEPAMSLIDVAVFYTPAARRDAGGVPEIEAVIDLMVAAANQAYANSGVKQRIALVATREIEYAEVNQNVDLRRLADPADGYMDEVHAIRDEVGADLVHFLPLVGGNNYTACGKAWPAGSVGLTGSNCDDLTFAHELGHNMGLRHDRYSLCGPGNPCLDWPFRHGYGYVNPRGLESGAPDSQRWITIMAYHSRCSRAGVRCQEIPRFSNPEQTWNGDPLGVAGSFPSTDVDGPANAVDVLNLMRHSVATYRDRYTNQSPVTTGTLPDLTVQVGDDVAAIPLAGLFNDPDGDALTYRATSSAPSVVTARVVGAELRLSPVGTGLATIEASATDIDGSNTRASLLFTVTVIPPITVTPTIAFSTADTGNDGLFTLEPRGARAAARHDPATLRWRDVAIDIGRFTGTPAAMWPSGSPTLTLNLFDDVTLTGIVERRTTTFSGGYALSGHLAGVESGTMTLVVNGNVVAGTVRTPTVNYRIRPAGVGRHAVIQVDPSRLPPRDEPLFPGAASPTR